MKSKQINFFVLPEELHILHDYLVESGWAIAPVELTAPSLEDVLLSDFDQLPIGESVYLFRTEDEENLQFEAYEVEVANEDGEIEMETRYAIDQMVSPVIEWWLPEMEEQNKRLKRGRLFFVKSYFEGEENIEKEEFTKEADKLFRWFRKHYPRVKFPELKSFHITEPVTQWMEREHGELVQFTIAS